MASARRRMGNPDYDDWGNPIQAPSFPQKREPGLAGLVGSIRSYTANIIRRYRTILGTVLFIVCFLLYYTTGEPRPKKVDWSNFAYVQYVTDNHNLCNAFMVFESLHRLGSKADRVLFYPQEWDLEDESPGDRVSQLLLRAQHNYGVKLKPITLMSPTGPADAGTLNAPSTWDTSITKLYAFGLYDYLRVIHLDSDITLLKHLDHLFHLPSTPIAMPRAYWSDAPAKDWQLTSLLMLIEPNPLELRNFQDILEAWKLAPDFAPAAKYDMDLINHRFGASAMVLPHRNYALLTSEFRRENHSAYLGTINGPQEGHSRYTWDAKRMYAEASLVHFSDWPLPKPWIMWPHDGLAELQPDCGGAKEGTCDEREIWKGLYADFRKRRKKLCRILSVPAPSWADLKPNGTIAV
ncbi:hypothetical protein TI39_contig4229g00006 [Zymoseptoria brevis]|uniref:Glycosyltransferase family 8 protein n=1 Tax=Zymoseptoria brevis TaxID=1047168 RepID=A0A0F4G9F6_9PEZI|nr:hypothetical protein TI39_contig4229g00006 [Zymoseptoria brevis]